MRRNTLLGAPLFFLLLSCSIFTTVTFGQDLSISIGEQPPLLSKSGGIVDLVIAAAFKAEGVSISFNWLPIGRMLTLLQ